MDWPIKSSKESITAVSHIWQLYWTVPKLGLLARNFRLSASILWMFVNTALGLLNNWREPTLFSPFTNRVPFCDWLSAGFGHFSISILDSLENIVESWHKLDFRGIYVGLLISCQEKASGDFSILQIMPWIQLKVIMMIMFSPSWCRHKNRWQIIRASYSVVKQSEEERASCFHAEI